MRRWHEAGFRAHEAHGRGEAAARNAGCPPPTLHVGHRGRAQSPPPPPPPMTEFEKSLAWMKEFIDDVEDEAQSVCEDESEHWLGAWGNPTKEDFLKHLAVVSKGESSPDVG